MTSFLVTMDAAEEFKRKALQAHPYNGGSAQAFKALLARYRAQMELSAASAPGARPAQVGQATTPKPAAASREAAQAAGKARGKATVTQLPLPFPIGKLGREALALLESSIRAVSRDQRQGALEALPQRVRVALLAFMRAGGTTRSPLPQMQGGPGLEPPEKELLGHETLAFLERTMRCDGPHYRAHLYLLVGIELRTQYVTSLEAAIDMLAWLVHARALFQSAASCSTSQETGSGQRGQWLRERFQAALAQAACARDGQMRLSFRAFARCLRTKLEGPYTVDLEAALGHLEQMTSAEARGSWVAAREVLVQIRQSPTQRRLRELSSTEASQRVDYVHAPLVRSRLLRAGRLVERALDMAEKRHSRKARGHGKRPHPGNSSSSKRVKASPRPLAVLSGAREVQVLTACEC